MDFESFISSVITFKSIITSLQVVLVYYPMIFIFLLVCYCNMKYVRNQFVRTGSLMWWIFMLMMGGGGLGGGIYLLQWHWAGISPMIIGVAILYRLILTGVNRDKIRRIVLHEFEKNPESSIRDIMNATGISRRDVRSIILNLKSSGLIVLNRNSHISTETGQLQYLSSQEEQSNLEEKIKYCESCGTQISNESDLYCSYCGAKL